MTRPTSTSTAAGIACPACGGTAWHVVRTASTRTGILRRRQCTLCGSRLTTRERPIGSVTVITPAISVGQIAKSLDLLDDQPIRLPTDPQN